MSNLEKLNGTVKQMKPILIDVSKFGGESVMPELQKLVDEAYGEGFKDAVRRYRKDDDEKTLLTPSISFSEDGMVMSDDEPWSL